MVGALKWRVTTELSNFQGRIAHKEALLHSNSHKTAKFLAYIINQLSGDFQQGGCLYKPTSGIQWTSKHLWRSDGPQKQASAKADPSTFSSGVVVIS